MTLRVVDYVRHEPSSRQALEMILRYWKVSRTAPILLLTPPGMALDIVQMIRVALSRERSAYSVEQRAYYGLRNSEVFPYTVGKQKNEALILRWTITQLQHMKNTMRTVDDILAEDSYDG